MLHAAYHDSRIYLDPSRSFLVQNCRYFLLRIVMVVSREGVVATLTRAVALAPTRPAENNNLDFIVFARVEIV